MKRKGFKSKLLNELTLRKLFNSEESKEITYHFLKDIVEIDVDQATIHFPNNFSAEMLEYAIESEDEPIPYLQVLGNLENGQPLMILIQCTIQSLNPESLMYDISLGLIENIHCDNPPLSFHCINIVNESEQEATQPDPITYFTMQCQKSTSTQKNISTEMGTTTLTLFELPKVTKKSNQELQEWHSLFTTGNVSADAPSYLKEAADFIAYDNLTKKERELYKLLMM